MIVIAYFDMQNLLLAFGWVLQEESLACTIGNLTVRLSIISNFN